jgi:hypothetical protein
MPLGALVFEREPLQLKDLPSYFHDWVQIAGGWAAFAALLWLAFGLPRLRRADWASFTPAAVLGNAVVILFSAGLCFGFWFGFATRMGVTPFDANNYAVLSWCGLLLLGLLALGAWLSRSAARFAGWKASLFTACAILAVPAYLVVGVVRVPEFATSFAVKRTGPFGTAPIQAPLNVHPALLVAVEIALTVGGVCALVAVLTPFLSNMALTSFRRIYAIAKLSFKEAVRRRILYAFALILLVFLFATWFLRTKPEDQVRTYVTLVSFAMAVLLLFAAVAMASFSIPADIRQQTIHTILTKPVQRFEVVLGRFLGFTALMTVVLVVMSSVCLLYILREIDPEAARESLKARAPLYGDLHFENTADPRRGDSVGNEWEYRGYIGSPFAGQQTSPATAVWGFGLPGGAGDRVSVPCEMTFAVYRTTKGKENQGVDCRLVFTTWRADPKARNDFKSRWSEKERFHSQNRRQISEELEKRGLKGDLLEQQVQKELRDQERPLPEVLSDLSEEMGCYIADLLVTNAHTQSVQVPGGLFKNAARPDKRQSGKPPITVEVTCTSPTQYIGMARYDLYFRLDDSSPRADRFWFAFNFFKGVFGLWLRLCLIIGLAVALSTYLTGVISLLIALLLFLGGETRDFVQSIGVGVNPGGGPVESLIRVTTRQNMITPMEDSTLTRVVQPSDVMFRWVIRRVLDILPDTQRLVFRPYVAEGFNIGGDQLLLATLLTFGYLLPWFVLAYYLIRWREVASAT